MEYYPLLKNKIQNESVRVLMTGITSIHGWPVFAMLRNMMGEDRLLGVRPPKMKVPRGPNSHNVCVTDAEFFWKVKREFNPTHVVHCSGVCDLDVCEERPDWARSLNEGGACLMREIFGDASYLLYLSSDLVFSGDYPPKGGYKEDFNPDPVSVAGKTILMAEKQIEKAKRWAILRLGLPIGSSVTGTKGAVDWVEGRFKKNKPVTLFHDEYRSCVDCLHIPLMAARFLYHEYEGIFHWGGNSKYSLNEVGRMVLNKGSYPKELLKSKSRLSDFGGPPRIGDVTMNLEKIYRLTGQIAVLRHMDLKDVDYLEYFAACS